MIRCPTTHAHDGTKSPDRLERGSRGSRRRLGLRLLVAMGGGGGGGWLTITPQGGSCVPILTGLGMRLTCRLELGQTGRS